MGGFIWYELLTPDPDAAAQFYGAVVGWTIQDGGEVPAGDIDYRHILRSDGGSNGGVLRLTDDMASHGAKPMWVPYLHVAEVDAAVAAIEAEGGRRLMPTTTIEVGSFAMLRDPQGVPIYAMAPLPPPGKPEAKSDVFSVDQPQHVRWNELASPDLDASKAFYAKHFGFTFDNVMDMGPMGDYCFADVDGVTVGAVMQRADPAQPAAWLLYFGVPSLIAAREALLANGGTIHMDTHQVPGGDWIVVASDPQGAAFGLVGPKGE